MNIAISRALAPSEAGIVFLAFTLVMLTATFCRLGFDTALLRLVPDHITDGRVSDAASAHALAVRVVSTVAISIAIAVFLAADPIAQVVFDTPSLAPVLRASVWSVPLLSLVFLDAYALFALGRVAKGGVATGVTFPLLVTGLILAKEPSTGTSVAWLLTVSAAAAFLLARIWVRAAFQGVRRSACYPANRLVRIALPLFGFTVLAELSNWSAQLILAAWSEPAQVALYNAAHRTAMLVSFLMVAANAVAARHYSSLFHQGRLSKLKTTARIITLFVAVPSVALSVCMMIYPAFFLSFFGTEYVAAEDALRLLALGNLVNVTLGPVAYLLAMTGHQSRLLMAASASTSTAVALALVLVPQQGLNGAAAATAGGLVLLNVLCWAMVRRYLGFSTVGSAHSSTPPN